MDKRKTMRHLLMLSAGCALLAGCGAGNNGDEAQPTPYQVIPENLTPGAETPGTTDEDGYVLSEEEQAETQVVLDTGTDRLMYQGIYYEMDGEAVRIVDYYNIDLTELVLPDEIVYEGVRYPVTEIGEESFTYFIGLEKVTLGANIKKIDTSAFDGCSELTEIVFSTGLEVIGDLAFNGCELLTEIEVPEGVTEIGEEAFCSCSGLERITLPESLTNMGINVFFDCSALTQISIPASLQTLPYGTFTNCSALEKVELNEGLLIIDEESFWACESLKELEIPSSVVMIGDQAFYSAGLQSITFPAKNITLGEGIFDFCDEMAQVYVPAEQQAYYENLLEDYELNYEAR